MSDPITPFIWMSIKKEARLSAVSEPILASFYHATLLKHGTLGAALSYLLAGKLASPVMPAVTIREIADEAYARQPGLMDARQIAETKSNLASMIHVGRMGTANDVASAVLFLASDESEYMLGAETAVDGGFAQL